jgi:hypothetical protein
MHLRLWFTVPLAAPAAFLVLVGFPVRSEASIGIGVQDGPVRLASVAQPGKSYDLPPVGVINTGTHAEAVSVHVERVSRGGGRLVPPSWVEATGPSVRLLPHHATRIPLKLTVPADAKPGVYLSDIVVVAATANPAGTANLGVAAATKLEFSVGPAPAPGAAVPPWSWWAAAGLVLLTISAMGIRRSGLRVRVERITATRSAIDQEGGHRA